MSNVKPAVIILSLLVFIAASSASAQPRRPDKGDGEAIRGKVQQVLDKTETLNNNLDALCNADCAATPAGGKFKSKVERLKRAHGRVKDAHGRSANDDFQEFNRKRPKKADNTQLV